MAVLTIAAFLSKYNSIFADNTTRAISEEDMRDFRQDIADSFQSVLGATTITSWKSPCVVATTANITLSGEQTIDGVLTSASRVLVRSQTSTLQNGIYVSAAGAWSRATDADSAAELEGAAVGVTQGTTLQNTVWVQTTDSITLETSAIAWQQVGYAATVNVLDEDDMASDSATEPPSQQSVKAYVDAQVASAGGSLQSATVTLSAAEILDLNSTPKQIIAAPGANKVISVHRAFLIYTFVTSAYATNTTLRIYWNGVSTTPVGYNNLLLVTENRHYTSVGNTLAGAFDASNKALMVEVQTGNPTGGDSTIKIIVEYSIIDI